MSGWQEEKRYLLSELSMEKEQHHETLTKLEAAHQKLEKLNALSDQLQEAEAQLQETQVALLAKDRKIHAAKQQAAAAEARATALEKELTQDADAAAMRREMARIVKENDDLRVRVRSVEGELEEAHLNRDLGLPVQGEEAAPSAALAAAETRAKRLDKQLSVFKERAGEDARRQQQRIATLEADVKRKSMALEQLQESIESFGAGENPANQANDKLWADLEDLQSRYEHVEAERDMLQAELNEATEELRGLRTELAVANDALAQVDALNAELRAAKRELARAQDNDGAVDSLNKELRAAKRELARVQENDNVVDQLKAELRAAKHDLARAQESDGVDGAEMSRLQRDLDATRDQLRAATAAEADAAAQCTALRQQVEALQASVQRITSQAERERKAIRLANIRAMKDQIEELKSIVGAQKIFEKQLVSVL